MDLTCYLRINKNASTSVCHILRQNYSADAFLEVILQGRRGVDGRAKNADGLDEDVHMLLNEVQSRRGNLGCIAVNLPYGLHRYVDRNLTYFTLLREPVARCVSYWRFAYRTRHEGSLWRTLEKYDFNIRQICEAGAVYQLANDQVRMISGSSAPRPGMAEFQLACDNIKNRFAFVGAVELFDTCLQALCRRFAWYPVPCPRLNAGCETGSPELPLGAEERFREANEWDIKLYDWLRAEYLPSRLAV